MDFERYRQSEAAEQAEGLRRQVQSEILTDEQTHVKLCYASIAVGIRHRRDLVADRGGVPVRVM